MAAKPAADWICPRAQKCRSFADSRALPVTMAAPGGNTFGVDVVIPRDGFDLRGDLVLPSDEAVCGVVMLGGSGATDRVNDGYFEPIRAHLVRKGIAVLSCDKRGVGASGGAWVDGTLSEFADDALASVGFLRAALPSGVPTAIYGHSEGGWVTLIAAAREPAGIDRIVTTSCPGVSPGAQDRYALNLELAGSPNADQVLSAYDGLLLAEDYVSASAALAAAPKLRDLFGNLTEAQWLFLRRKKDYDPIPDAQAVRCPWLALYGLADPLVPVSESIAAFGDQPIVRTFPGANHRLEIDGALAPGFLGTISDWLLSAS
jgi:pimeloyl-ACP methyl ester carboxylesterase